MCSNVGLCVWAPNIMYYSTEPRYFLMKFLGNNNAVGLEKKESKSFLQLFFISRPHFVSPTFYSLLFPCTCFQIRDNLEEIAERSKNTQPNENSKVSVVFKYVILIESLLGSKIRFL